MIKNLKPNPIFKLLLCGAAICIAGIGTAAAQSVEPKTVADFFRLVPERYMIGYDRRFREEMLSGEHRGVIIDIANGYISYDASDNPTGFEFAIFRKTNGRYIVAFSDSVSDNFDWEINDGYEFFLLSYEGGKWRDLTKTLLPVPRNKRNGYALPRHGRTIVVTSDSGRTLYTLTWVNDGFRLRSRKRWR
jgi:hypothetical protein